MIRELLHENLEMPNYEGEILELSKKTESISFGHTDFLLKLKHFINQRNLIKLNIGTTNISKKFFSDISFLKLEKISIFYKIIDNFREKDWDICFPNLKNITLWFRGRKIRKQDIIKFNDFNYYCCKKNIKFFLKIEAEVECEEDLITLPFRGYKLNYLKELSITGLFEKLSSFNFDSVPNLKIFSVDKRFLENKMTRIRSFGKNGNNNLNNININNFSIKKIPNIKDFQKNEFIWLPSNKIKKFSIENCTTKSLSFERNRVRKFKIKNCLKLERIELKFNLIKHF